MPSLRPAVGVAYAVMPLARRVARLQLRPLLLLLLPAAAALPSLVTVRSALAVGE